MKIWPSKFFTLLIVKPTRCTNFSIYFWNKSLHVSDSSSVHHQEYFTVHTGWNWFHPDPACKLSANLYYICHCCVYSEKLVMMDGGNSLKHVEFYSKNKYEKLVHLVGFIIRIYHATRSPESQISSSHYKLQKIPRW